MVSSILLVTQALAQGWDTVEAYRCMCTCHKDVVRSVRIHQQCLYYVRPSVTSSLSCAPDTTDLTRIMRLPWHPKRALSSSTSPDRKMGNCSDRTFSTLEAENRYCIYLKQQMWFSELLPGIIFLRYLLKAAHRFMYGGVDSAAARLSSRSGSFFFNKIETWMVLAKKLLWISQKSWNNWALLYSGRGKRKWVHLWIKWQACFLPLQLFSQTVLWC